MIGKSFRPNSPRIRRVAVSPSITGIRTSISSASKAVGRLLRSSTACCPSAAKVTIAPSRFSARSATSRFMALSSTTSTRIPARRGPVGGGAGRAGAASRAPSAARGNGSSNQKVLPSPT